MKRIKNIIKPITYILLFSFCWTYIFSQTVFGIVLKGYEVGKLDEIISETESFILPYRHGRITEVWQGKSNSLVLLIQDLHCHPEVQRNIFEIIKLFDDKYDVRKILVEGAPNNKVNSVLFTTIPDKNICVSLLDYLLNKGLISGAEYYESLLNKGKLYGVEEWQVYNENYERIKRLLSLKSDNIDIVNNIVNKIEYLKDKYLSKKIKKIEKSINKEFYEKHAAVKIDFNFYPEIEKYLRIKQFSKQINVKKVNHELKLYLEYLRSILSYRLYNSLQQKLSYSANIEEYYLLLVLISERYDTIKVINKYPNLSKFFKYIKLNYEINPQNLIVEEKLLKEEILNRYINNQIEKEILFLYSFANTVKNLVALNINPKEYEYYKSNKERFIILLKKYFEDVEIKNIISILENKDFEDFYSTNIKRNEIFFNSLEKLLDNFNIVTNKEPTDNLDILSNLQNFKIYILVTGGFHTEITKFFKNKEISYIVISPNVTKDYNNEIYEKIILGNINIELFLKNAFAPQLANVGLSPETAEGIMMGFILMEILQGKDFNSIQEDINKWKERLKETSDSQGLSQNILRLKVSFKEEQNKIILGSREFQVILSKNGKKIAIKDIKLLSKTENFSLRNKLYIVGGSIFASIIISFLLTNSLFNPVLLLFSTVINSLYLLEFGYLIKAKFKFGKKYELIEEFKNKPFIEETRKPFWYRPAFVEGETIYINTDSLIRLPQWLQKIIYHHETRHLALKNRVKSYLLREILINILEILDFLKTREGITIFSSLLLGVTLKYFNFKMMPFSVGILSVYEELRIIKSIERAINEQGPEEAERKFNRIKNELSDYTRAYMLNMFAVRYGWIEKFDECFDRLKQSKQIAEKIENKELKEKLLENIEFNFSYFKIVQLFKDGKIDEAEELTKIMFEDERWSEDIDLYIILSRIYVSKAMYDEAIKLVNQAIKRNISKDKPIKYSELLVSRGIANYFKNHIEKAKRDFQEAGRLNPRNSTVFSYLGEVNLMLGNTDEAIKNFEISLKLGEENKVVLQNLVLLYLERKMFGKAENLILKIVRIDDYLSFFEMLPFIEKEDELWQFIFSIKNLFPGNKIEKIKQVIKNTSVDKEFLLQMIDLRVRHLNDAQNKKRLKLWEREQIIQLEKLKEAIEEVFKEEEEYEKLEKEIETLEKEKLSYLDYYIEGLKGKWLLNKDWLSLQLIKELEKKLSSKDKVLEELKNRKSRKDAIVYLISLLYPEIKLTYRMILAIAIDERGLNESENWQIFDKIFQEIIQRSLTIEQIKHIAEQIKHKKDINFDDELFLPVSVGKNIEEIVMSNFGSDVLEEFVELAVDFSQQLIDLFRDKIISEKEKYKKEIEILQNHAIEYLKEVYRVDRYNIEVEISNNPILIQKDAWSLATIEVNNENNIIKFYLHELLIKAINVLPKKEKDIMLKLLVEHELDECFILNDYFKESEIYEEFNKWLEENEDSTKNLENFHKYLYSINSQQIELLNFANALVEFEERVLKEYKLHHQNRDYALILQAYFIALQKYEEKSFLSGETYIEHSLSVAERLARWGADEVTIASALLHKVPLEELRKIPFVKSQGDKIIKMVRKLNTISQLPYIDGENIYTLRGSFSLQNYMNMMILLAGDADTMLLVFADKLQTLSKVSSRYYAQEIQHIFIPLAMRLNAMNIAEELRNEMFRLIFPEEYELWKSKVEEILQKSYSEMDEEINIFKNKLIEYLKSKGVKVENIIIESRIKTPYSVWEKITSQRRGEYKGIYELQDIIGLRMIIPVSEKEEISYFHFLSMYFEDLKEKGMIKDVKAGYSSEIEKGFDRIKFNFTDDKGRKYEFVIITERDLDKIVTGSVDETTYKISIPYWIYKMGKLLKIHYENEFVVEIESLLFPIERKSFRQSFIPDGISLSYDFYENFNKLYNLLKNNLFIFYLHRSKKGNELGVVSLPKGSLPADAAAYLEIDCLDEQYCGFVRVEVSKKDDGSLLNIENKDKINEDKPLNTGDIISISDDKKEVFLYIPERQLKTYRARWIVRKLKDEESVRWEREGKDYVNKMIKNEISKILKSIVYEKLNYLYKQYGFKDINEFYSALGGGIINKNVLLEYLKGKRRRVISVKVGDPKTFTEVIRILNERRFDLVDIREDSKTYRQYIVEERDDTLWVDNGELRREVAKIKDVIATNVQYETKIFNILSLTSLGKNLIHLLSFNKSLSNLSLSLAEKLILLFTGQKGEYLLEEKVISKRYKEYIEGIKEEFSLKIKELNIEIEIKVSNNPLLIKEDSWSLATISIDKENKKATIYIHQLLLEGLKLIPLEKRKKIIKLFVDHEINEYYALNVPNSKIYRNFNEWCKKNSYLEINSEIFHQYLYSVNSEQVELLNFAEELVKMYNLGGFSLFVLLELLGIGVFSKEYKVGNRRKGFITPGYIAYLVERFKSLPYEMVRGIFGQIIEEWPEIRKIVTKQQSKFTVRIDKLISEIIEERWNVYNIHQRWQPAVVIFGSSRLKETDKVYRYAYKLGELLAKEGYYIRTGAGPGIMEAAPKGYIDSQYAEDKLTQGVKISIPFEEVSPYIQDCFSCNYFVTRKLGLHQNAICIVIFPGGYGTLDELFEVWYREKEFILFRNDFYGEILSVLYEAWEKVGLLQDIPLKPQIVDEPEHVIKYLKDIKKDNLYKNNLEDIEKANSELEKGLRKLAKWEPAVVLTGNPKKDSKQLQEAEYVIKKLLLSDIPVRIGSRGSISDAVIRISKELKKEHLVQAIFNIENDQLNAPEKQIKKQILTSHLSVEQVLLTENSLGHIFFVGGLETFKKLFDLICNIQTNKTYRRPIYLIGSDFWKDVKDTIDRKMLEYGPGLILESDKEISTVIDVEDIEEIIEKNNWSNDGKEKNLKKKFVQQEEIDSSIQQAIKSGHAISFIPSQIDIDIENISNDPKKLAEFFVRNFDFDNEEQKILALKKLEQYFARSDNISIVLSAIKFVIKTIENSHQKTLSNRRIVILLTEDNVFDKGYALEHAGSNSIYLHVNLILGCYLFTLPTPYRNGENMARIILSSILEHADRDLQRGYHKDDISSYNWKLVKEFWDILLRKRVLSEERKEYLELIREKVNPHNDRDTVLYIGSGGDITTALLATNAKKFVFVDMLDFERLDYVEDEYTFLKYAVEKYLQSWSLIGTLLLDINSAKEILLYELQTIEAKVIEVKEEIINKDGDKRYKIRFILPGEDIEREIVYYEKDINVIYDDYLKILVKEFYDSGGIDFFITKAFSFDLPYNLRESIFDLLNTNGYLIIDVTDETQWVKNYYYLEKIESQEIEDFERRYNFTFGHGVLSLLIKKEDEPKEIKKVKSTLYSHFHPKDIRILERKQRYFQDGLDYKETYLVEVTFPGDHKGIYFVKTRRTFTKENEELACKVLSIFNIPNPETEVVEDYFVSKYIGEDINNFREEIAHNKEFRNRLAYELGKAAYVSYILCLYDRSLSNVRVVLSNNGFPYEIVNIDLSTAFLNLDSSKLFEVEISMLSQLLNMLREYKLSENELLEIIESFLRGFRDFYNETKRYYLQNKEKIEDELNIIEGLNNDIKNEVIKRILDENLIEKLRDKFVKTFLFKDRINVYYADIILGKLFVSPEDVFLNIAESDGYLSTLLLLKGIRKIYLSQIRPDNFLNLLGKLKYINNGLGVLDELPPTIRLRDRQKNVVQNMSIFKGDNVVIDLENDSVTKVSITEFFNWFKQQSNDKKKINDVVYEVLRVVKPGGKIYIHDVKDLVDELKNLFDKIAKDNLIDISIEEYNYPEDDKKGLVIKVISKPKIFYIQNFSHDELMNYEKIVIKGYKIPQNGQIKLFGRYWGQISEYAGKDVEILINQGFIVGIRILRNKKVINFSIVMDNKTKKIIDTFCCQIGQKRLKGKSVTIKHWYLDSHGNLNIGGKKWARFEEYAGGEVELEVEDGVVKSIKFVSTGEKKDFSLVYDKEGKLIDSFLGGIIRSSFKNLGSVTIKKFNLDSRGNLNIGGNCVTTFKDYPNAEVEIDVAEEGVVTAVRVVKNGKIVEERLFALIFDNSSNKLVDSFYGKMSKKRLESFKDHTIKKFYLDNTGVLNIGGEYYGRFDSYPGAEVEILIKDGKPIKIVFVKDKKGKAIFDFEGNSLEINLNENIVRQMREKSVSYRKKQYEKLFGVYLIVQDLLNKGDVDKAYNLLKNILFYYRRRKIKTLPERVIGDLLLEMYRMMKQKRKEISEEMMRARLNSQLNIIERLVSNGEYEEARKMLKNIKINISNIDKRFPDIEKRRSELLLLCRKEIRNDENQVLFESAKVYYEGGKYEKAHKLFVKLSKRRTIDEKMRSEVEKYISLCKQYSALLKNRELFEKAKELFYEGSYREALKLFIKLRSRKTVSEEIKNEIIKKWIPLCREYCRETEIIVSPIEKFHPYPYLSDEEKFLIFQKILYGTDEETQQAVNKLVEHYIWQVKNILSNMVFKDLEDFLMFGIEYTYQIITEYIEEYNNSDIESLKDYMDTKNFDDYFINRITQFFKELKTRIWSSRYKERPLIINNGDEPFDLLDVLHDEKEDVVEEVLKKFERIELLEALKNLTEKELLIVVGIAVEGRTIEELTEELNLSEEEVVEILNNGLEKIRKFLGLNGDEGVVSLGKNVELLIIRILTETLFSPLPKLANYSIKLQEIIMELFKGKNDEFLLEQKTIINNYKEIVEILKELISKEYSDYNIQIKVSNNPVLIQPDAWSLGTVEFDEENRQIRLYIHEKFLNSLKRYYTPYQAAILSLYIEHEFKEYEALVKKTNREFNEFCERNALPKNYESFHRYILEVNPLQKLLFDFAEVVIHNNRDIRTSEVMRKIAKVGEFYFISNTTAKEIFGLKEIPSNIIILDFLKNKEAIDIYSKWFKDETSLDYLIDDPSAIHLHYTTFLMLKMLNYFDKQYSLKGKTVLDIGSGRGDLCIYASKLGAKRVYGVEKEESLCELSKTITRNNNVNNVIFIKGRSQECLPDNISPDVVLINLSKYDEVDNAIKSVLKKYPSVKYFIISGINISLEDTLGENMIYYIIDHNKGKIIYKDNFVGYQYDDTPFCYSGIITEIDNNKKENYYFDAYEKFNDFVKEFEDRHFRNIKGNFAIFNIGLMVDNETKYILPINIIKFAKKFSNLHVYAVDDMIPKIIVKYEKDNETRYLIINQDNKILVAKENYKEEFSVLEETEEEIFFIVYLLKDVLPAAYRKNKFSEKPGIVEINGKYQVIYHPYELGKGYYGVSNIEFLQSTKEKDKLKRTKFDFSVTIGRETPQILLSEKNPGSLYNNDLIPSTINPISMVKKLRGLSFETSIPNSYKWILNNAEDLFGKTVINILPGFIYEKDNLEKNFSIIELLQITDIGMNALGVSLLYQNMPVYKKMIDKEEIIYIGKIIVPIYGKEEIVKVYATKFVSPITDKSAIILLLSHPEITKDMNSTDYSLKEKQILLLCRGTLSVLKEIKEGRREFKQILSNLGLPFDDIKLTIINLNGKKAVLALPKVIKDEFSEDEFLNSLIYNFIIYSTDEINSLRIPKKNLDKIGFNNEIFNYNILSKEIIDLTKIGLVFADVVSCDSLETYYSVINLYSEFKNFIQDFYTSQQITLIEDKIRRYIKDLWLPIYRIKFNLKNNKMSEESISSNSITRTTLACTLPIFSLRNPKINYGIGKITDILETFRTFLKPAGIETILLLPHFSHIDTNPYKPTSFYSINEFYIDWIKEAENMGLSKNIIDTLKNKVETSFIKKDIIDYQEVEKIEFEVSEIVYNHFLNKKDKSNLELFKKQNFSWLDKYSSFMASYKILGRYPRDIDEIKGISEQNYSLFLKYKSLYEYMQYVAYKQLTEIIKEIHKEGGKIIFDLPFFRLKFSVDNIYNEECFLRDKSSPRFKNQNLEDLILYNWDKLAESNYELIFSPVRHWLKIGFDGIKLDKLHFAYPLGDIDKGIIQSGNEKGDQFVSRLFYEIKKIKPEAIIIADLQVIGKDIKEYYGIYTLANVSAFSEEKLKEIIKNKKIWLEITSYDSPRIQNNPEIVKNYNIEFNEESFKQFFNKILSSGAEYASFVIGDQWGDDREVKEIIGGKESFIYRIPIPSQRKFDISNFLNMVINISNVKTEQGYYERGYIVGKNINLANLHISETIRQRLQKVQNFKLLGEENKERIPFGDINAPGLHCLLVSYQWIKFLGEKGKLSLIYHSKNNDFFSKFYEILSYAGLTKEALPEVYSYVKFLERQSLSIIDIEEKTKINIQFIGFIQGFLENMLYNDYLKRSAQEISIYKDVFSKLLVSVDSFIIRDENNNLILNSGYPILNKSVIGRNTFMNLIVMLLVTNQFEYAKEIFRYFAKFQRQDGLIPNNIDENGKVLDYNSADVSLWFIESLFKYYEFTKDKDFVKEMLPVVNKIIYRYIQPEGEIYIDKDNLIVVPPKYTWMNTDSTPRDGKPIEIQALFYNALQIVYEFNKICGEDKYELIDLANKVKNAITNKYFNQTDYPYDVLESKNDYSEIRPNAVFLISLSKVDGLLFNSQKERILNIIKDKLLTPYGLKTLTEESINYKGVYDIFDKDKKSSHQGVVYPWLLREYILAKAKTYQNKSYQEIIDEIKLDLNNIVYFIKSNNVLPEMFNNKGFYEPSGCISCGLSVAGILEVLDLLNREYVKPTLVDDILNQIFSPENIDKIMSAV